MQLICSLPTKVGSGNVDCPLVLEENLTALLGCAKNAHCYALTIDAQHTAVFCLLIVVLGISIGNDLQM